MESKFTEVRYDRTFNLGSYESEKLGVTYSMADGEDIFKAIEHVKSVVLGKNVVKEEVKVVEAKKEEPKKKKADPKPVEKVEESVEEETVEEPVKEEPKKKKAGKTITYNRKDDIHKKRLAEFLDADFPKWKDPAILKKAASISAEFDGKEAFLDAEGNILDSFKTNFLGKLKAY